jgi:hypothetical protein
MFLKSVSKIFLKKYDKYRFIVQLLLLSFITIKLTLLLMRLKIYHGVSVTLVYSAYGDGNAFLNTKNSRNIIVGVFSVEFLVWFGNVGINAIEIEMLYKWL